MDSKHENNSLAQIALNTANDLAASRYLIVDRLKAVFATEPRIKDLNSMRQVVNQRNNAYKKLS